MPSFLDQDIKFLAGVGPKKAEILNKELNISTFRDLLYYFPFKYTDRTKFYAVSELNQNLQYIQLKGQVISADIVKTGKTQRLVANFSDGTGMIELVWFQGIKWQKDIILLNQTYIIFGKPVEFGNKINIVHPEMELADQVQQKNTGIFQAHYITTEKMKNKFLHSKTVSKLIQTLLSLLAGKIRETLPAHLISKLRLLSLEKSLFTIHQPENSEELKKAQFRLKFEELFLIQLKILTLKHIREDKIKGFRFASVGYNFNTFYSNYLPFPLTNAQKKVIKEIRRDLNRDIQMNRLLQGDVGSGKTLVALMTMLIGIDNGFQSCMMAPTEILALQHFNSISKFLNGMNVEIRLLTGSTKNSDRAEIQEGLESGRIQILTGTHALLEEKVTFKQLGLVVIDEQHRFGVEQRSKLWKKNDSVPPHVLVMTATPIPRTLAMTVYGDLDVSVIDELPPGRKPIQTMHIFDNKRSQLYNFLLQQLNAGRQVYVVYPLITESEKMNLKNLEEGHKILSEVFGSFNVRMFHGKMKSAEKEQIMSSFKNGEINILVATTVIEVGVDVPNASVMVIENAERFGLSQLHQLRGRVGRGAEQSFCILISSFKLSDDSKKRISAMVRTNDGFEIAEMDLKLRGPGDIEGTQQSGIGIELKIARLSQDGKILQLARNMALDILEKDPELKNPENLLLNEKLKSERSASFNWSSIS